MKKTKLTRSLLAACSIVALSAVMYGCTSDGSKDELVATQEDLAEERAAHAATQGKLDTASSELMTANGEVTRLTGELGTANSALMTANGDVTRLTGELMTANGDVTRLMGELTTAQGNASGLQTQLTTAQGNVTRLMGELTTAQGERDTAQGDVTRLEGELTTAEGERDGYKQMLTALQAKIQADADAAAKAEDDNRVKGISTALGLDKLGDMTTNSPLTEKHAMYGITAERSASGATVIITVDPDTDTANDDYMASNAAGDPWSHAFVTKDTLDDEEQVTSTEEWMVVTDIMKPTPTPIALQFAEGMLHVVLGTGEREAELSDIMLSRLPASDDEQIIHANNADFEGSYLGIAGEFTCAVAENCTVMLDDDAANGFTISGDLQFTPDNVAATHPVQDTGYVYFGWWLDKPAKSDGEHAFETFVGLGGSTPPTARDSFDEIEGSASYSGMAVGKYVTKTFTAGVFAGGNVGAFTANAKLTASFDVEDADDDNTVSGSVTGFRDATSGDSLGGWKVTLAEKGLAAAMGSTNINLGAETQEGVGNWTAAWYYGDADDAPGTVIGEFDASVAGGVAHIAGAYGATQDD